MCQLGMKSRKFGLQSLDYLVDMFNDEIEAIRLKSINSLCKISSCLELREDQLETVLSILEVRTRKEGRRERKSLKCIFPPPPLS